MEVFLQIENVLSLLYEADYYYYGELAISQLVKRYLLLLNMIFYLCALLFIFEHTGRQ